MSQRIYELTSQYQTIGYTWDWGSTRPWSWVIHTDAGETQTTSINRYELDFRTKMQTNVDNGRRRSFRVVWTNDIEPAVWTGKLPD